jgi:surfactin synthase thioesterase subunit
MTLFCLPFAGGNSYSYRKFEHELPDWITVMAFDLPGHGKRLKEPLLANFERMTADIFHQIQDRLNGPYALYGHSMGTLLGYLLCKRIAQTSLAQPFHLFVSGRQGPSVESKEQDWYLLPKDVFIRKLLEYGGIPQEVAAEGDLMDLFVPILKADFQAVSEYRYEEAVPLTIPVTVMVGTDEGITYEEALQWQRITTQSVTVKQFSGNHFFIFDHVPEISRMIVQTLENQ